MNDHCIASLVVSLVTLIVAPVHTIACECARSEQTNREYLTGNRCSLITQLHLHCASPCTASSSSHDAPEPLPGARCCRNLLERRELVFFFYDFGRCTMQTALLVMVKVQQPSIGGGVTWPFSGCLLQHLTVLYCIVLYCSVLQYCSPAHPSLLNTPERAIVFRRSSNELRLFLWHRSLPSAPGYLPQLGTNIYRKKQEHVVSHDR